MGFFKSLGKALGSVGNAILGGIPGLISSGVNAVGSLINSNSQKKANEQNYRNSIELMKLQNQMQVDNWNMQNEYNSPANQMKRLQEAGLNPNLVYGNGADNTAGSVGSVSVHQPEMKPLNYGSSMQAAVDGLARYLQLESMKLQNNNLRAQNDKTYAEIQSILANTEGTGYSNDFYRQTLSDRIEGIRLGNELSRGNISLTSSNIRRADASTRQIESTIRLNESNIDFLRSKTKLNEVQIDQTYQAIQESISRVVLNKARSYSQSIDTQYRMALNPYLISKASWDAIHSMSDAQLKSFLNSSQEYRDSLIRSSVSDSEIKSWESYYRKYGSGGGAAEFPLRLGTRFIDGLFNFFKK